MNKQKIIKASAGTGKTFQLSLEYIALLCRGADYSQILIVTFTRKATAEIKKRIFGQLALLLAEEESRERTTLLNALQALLGADCRLADTSTIKRLRITQEEMLQNKNKLLMLTIDSFIQSIFSGIVVPYSNLYGFSQIEDKQNEEFLEQILITLLHNKEYWEVFKFIINANKSIKALKVYLDLLKMLIRNRHIFVDFQMPEPHQSSVELESSWAKMFAILTAIAEREGWGTLLKAGWEAPILKYVNNQTEAGLERLFKEKTADFLNNDYFWKIKSAKEVHPELLQLYSQFCEALATQHYNNKTIPFNVALKKLSQYVYNLYDDIKFKTKKFTHQDILYYTYSYLYKEELSLIDKVNGGVQNYFYEIIDNRLSYILIDEFQDTSLLQWHILLPIITESVADDTRESGFIAVGDEKQAIYGWRGGESSLMSCLKKIVPLATEQKLDISYRSQPKVMEFVNNIFSVLSTQLSDLRFLGWPYSEVKSFKTEEVGYVELSVDYLGRTTPEDEEVLMRKFVNKIKHHLEYNKLLLNKTAVIVRKNREMNALAILLEEAGIPCVLESATSIIDNPVIKPLYYLLCYFAYQDFYSLLRFLRSELVNLNSVQLKAILEVYNSEDNIHHFANLESYKELAGMDKLYKFIQETDFRKPVNLLFRDIIQCYRPQEKFKEENYAKNLLWFMEITDKYVQNRAEARQGVLEFVHYVEKHKEDEGFRQVSLNELNALQVITVHKAKGLEYDNVFYYWDISAQSSSDKGVQLASKYNEMFNSLQKSIAYQLEDRAVLERIDKYADLLVYIDEKEFVEEINNIYVALTRAKQNLSVFCICRKKLEDIVKIKGITEKRTDNMYYLLNQIVEKVTGTNLVELSESIYFSGLITPQDWVELEEPQKDYGFRKYLNLDTKLYPAENQLEEKVFFAGEDYIRGQITGNIVHLYLSHIKYNEPQEKVLAKGRVYEKYGEAFNPQEIKIIIDKTQEFIRKNIEYFTNNYKVFTEHIIFDGTLEYRIDRFLIDDKTKSIMIIDYKTGQEKDEEQLNKYKKLVQKLTFVKQGKYSVEVRFLMVEV